MIIGIDIGSTITKVVSIESGRAVNMVKTRAADALTSAAGAFGKLILENDIDIKDIEKINITGAGAGGVKNNLFGIETKKIGEFAAIGTGAMFQLKQDNIVITNIGTGTVIIHAEKNRITHMGGSGVGGGTVLGLAKKLLNTNTFNGVMDLAAGGDLSRVDLLLEDIMETELSFLGRDMTASNFGKVLDTARNEDVALAILNMVYQVIGMISVFAAKSKHIAAVAVTGSGSDNPVGKKTLELIGTMYGIRFSFPPHAEYTTAIGAGLM